MKMIQRDRLLQECLPPLSTLCSSVWGEVTQVREAPSPATCTASHVALPIDTVTFSVNPAPLMVTAVPPTYEPDVGLMPVTEKLKLKVGEAL